MYEYDNNNQKIKLLCTSETPNIMIIINNKLANKICKQPTNK